MTFVNEVSENYLETLKSTAEEKYQKERKDAFFSGIKIIAGCTIICVIFLSFAINNISGFFWLSAGIIVFSLIIGLLGFYILIKTIEIYPALKKPLADCHKEIAYESDLALCAFLCRLDTFNKLEKAEILNWTYHANEVHITYVENDDVIKHYTSYSDVKFKRGIDDSILALIDVGFVFYIPYKNETKK